MSSVLALPLPPRAERLHCTSSSCEQRAGCAIAASSRGDFTARRAARQFASRRCQRNHRWRRHWQRKQALPFCGRLICSAAPRCLCCFGIRQHVLCGSVAFCCLVARTSLFMIEAVNASRRMLRDHGADQYSPAGGAAHLRYFCLWFCGMALRLLASISPSSRTSMACSQYRAGWPKGTVRLDHY